MRASTASLAIGTVRTSEAIDTVLGEHAAVAARTTGALVGPGIGIAAPHAVAKLSQLTLEGRFFERNVVGHIYQFGIRGTRAPGTNSGRITNVDNRALEF